MPLLSLAAGTFIMKNITKCTECHKNMEQVSYAFYGKTFNV